MKSQDLPNPFDWSKYNIKSTKECRDHILENPYKCDECSDIYNKNDLIEYKNKHICRNCIDEYGRENK